MLVALSGNQGYPLPIFTLGASQNVSYNAAGGSSTQSTAFANASTGITEAILITTPANATSGDVRIAIGANPTASSTSTLLPSKAAMIFAVPKGGKLAVLSNDVGTGSICITELISYLPHLNDGTQ